MKYSRIWWEKYTSGNPQIRTSGKHRQQPENINATLTFVQNGIKGLLIEGYKMMGRWTRDDQERKLISKLHYSDFDLKGVVEYMRREKDVEDNWSSDYRRRCITKSTHGPYTVVRANSVSNQKLKLGAMGKIPMQSYEQEMVNHYNKTTIKNGET
jgi:exopolysaccharide biosynthesis protein